MERQNDGLGWFGWFLALAGSGWALLVVTATWFFGQRESVDARCILDGVGPDLAAYAAAGTFPEAVIPTGSFGWFPLGWTCRWELGSAIYTYAPGWGPTLLAAPGVIIALIPVLFWLAGCRRRRR